MFRASWRSAEGFDILSEIVFTYGISAPTLETISHSTYAEIDKLTLHHTCPSRQKLRIGQNCNLRARRSTDALTNVAKTLQRFFFGEFQRSRASTAVAGGGICPWTSPLGMSFERFASSTACVPVVSFTTAAGIGWSSVTRSAEPLSVTWDAGVVIPVF
jgi:hypothetical protein